MSIREELTTFGKSQAMAYKEYPEIPHTYVVHHTTGCGEQGGEPIREHEIVYSSDSVTDCLLKGGALYPPDPSGWTYDHFTINVNTLTVAGKLLLDEFHARVKLLEKHIKDNPNLYHTYTHDGNTITLRHNPELDENI